ncbi:TPA: hypothetical protein ACJMCM_000755 [Neisseria meningitidis]
MPSEHRSDGILYWIEIEPSLPRSGCQIADICQEDKKPSSVILAQAKIRFVEIRLF